MIYISKMSGKLKGLYSINVNPLITDFCINMHKSKNDKVICKKCYSIRILKTLRQNCIPNFTKNYYTLSESIIDKSDLPKIKHKYFRFNSHGELINNNHLINYINICNKNPNTQFTLWSKRTDIINKVLSEYKKPKNLILIYSNPIIDTITDKPNKYFDKVFNVIQEKDIKVNCGKKKCIDCLLCYKHNKVNTIIEKLK